MYVHNQTNGARSWMPCVDSPMERCTWELEFTTLAGHVVIAPGVLHERVRFLSNIFTRLFNYSSVQKSNTVFFN